MFSTIKALVGELHGINLRLKDLIELERRNAPNDERIDELERSRAMWEAEVEGILLKADGHQKAARSAEARTRTMKRHYEDQLDPFDPDSPQIEAPVPERHAEAERTEGVHVLSVGVAPDHKTLALRAKFQ